jgi:hypothetical protein
LPKLGEWGVSEVASCREVVVKAAAARKGISAEAGLTRRAIEAADRVAGNIAAVRGRTGAANSFNCGLEGDGRRAIGEPRLGGRSWARLRLRLGRIDRLID